MTEFRDDGETLHALLDDSYICPFCGSPDRLISSFRYSCIPCAHRYGPGAADEYARRVSNALAAPVKGERFLRRVVAAGEPEATVLAAPVRENPSTPECLHGPFCCQCEMNRLQAGEGPARFGDGNMPLKFIETDPRRCGGKPVLAGHRITARQLLGEIADSCSVVEVASDMDLPLEGLRGMIREAGYLLEHGEAREEAGEMSEPNRMREERDHYREKLFECQVQLAERTAELSSLTQRISDIAWENGGPVPVQTADENLTSIERYAHELHRELAERMTEVERLKAELENLQANPCQCEFGEYGWNSSRCPMHREGRR